MPVCCGKKNISSQVLEREKIEILGSIFTWEKVFRWRREAEEREWGWKEEKPFARLWNSKCKISASKSDDSDTENKSIYKFSFVSLFQG